MRSISNQSVPIAEHAVPIFSQILNNKQHQFQLNLQWQIFSKFTKRTNINLSKISYQQQENRIKLTEQKIKENYFKALSNVNISYENYKTNLIILNSQREKYNIAKEKYDNNLIDYFQFSMYQLPLQNAIIELTKSKYQWYFNRELLKLYN